MSSDLVFCSYQNGKWSEATSVDSANYHYSHNIQIGVTRKVDQIDEKGDRTSRRRPHRPRGVVGRHGPQRVGALRDAHDRQRHADRHPDRRPLALHERLAAKFRPVERPSSTTRSSATRRSFESNAHDTVDVVFGDLITNNMHRVTIKPTLDLRPQATAAACASRSA